MTQLVTGDAATEEWDLFLNGHGQYPFCLFHNFSGYRTESNVCSSELCVELALSNSEDRG